MNYNFAPKHVCWDITSACNDACRFCYRVTDQRNLKINQHFEIADKLIHAGVRKVSLVGGEPLLLPHLPELLRYLKNNGITTSIVTNGILLEKELSKIEMYLDWISLPLDGYSTESQKAMSRNPEHYNRTINLSNIILESGIRLKINSVISAKNIDYISLLAEQIYKIKPDRWKLFEFSPIRGAAKLNSESFIISHQLFIDNSQEVSVNAEKIGIHVTIADKFYLNRNYFSIDPMGKVRVTVDGKDKIAGDLLNSDIHEIWEYRGFDREQHWKVRDNLPHNFYKKTVYKQQKNKNLVKSTCNIVCE